MSFFDCYGPYKLEKGKGRTCPSDQSAMWKAIEDSAEGLLTAIGCYMFAIWHGETVTPWYIGMTVAKGGFRAEVLTRHKIAAYEQALGKMTGTPILILFPLYSTGERFSRAYKAGKPDIAWLEKTLMGFAFARNPEIENIRDMARHRTIQVYGLINDARAGRKFSGVKMARKALFDK